MYALIQSCLACLFMAVPIQPLLKTGDAAYLRGDYATALGSFDIAWISVQSLPAEDPARYDVLKRLTNVLRVAGEYPEADRYLQLAIAWRETNAGLDDRKLAEDLVAEIGLCRAMKDFDRGKAIQRRVLEMDLTAAQGQPTKAVADDYSRMAQLDLDQKKPEDAVSSLNLAVGLRTRLAGPLDGSLVPDLDKLGHTYIVLAQYDNAEFIFRQALVIRENFYGRVDPDLIATVDGLAYACFGQKKYDEAEALYQRLLSLWEISVGKDHPMYAIALEKVAVFYAEQKKFDEAKEMADRAAAIRAFSLATGLELEATQQWDAGEKENTKALLQRAVKVVEPPDPLYDGLHKEIAEVLASIDKPNKTPLARKTAAKK
jgi:tetratricopeptide (TPR) repeat protein